MSVDVDSKKVFDVSFNSDIESSLLDAFNCLINLPLIRSSQDRVISVEEVDNIAFVEDTVINL